MEKALRDSVHRVDNLADREEGKLIRMQIRFDRVGKFLSYLEEEEGIENERFSLSGRNSVVTDAIVPGMRDEYEQQRSRIEQRLRENRERYAEETVLEVAPEEEGILLRQEAEDAPEGPEAGEARP